MNDHPTLPDLSPGTQSAAGHASLPAFYDDLDATLVEAWGLLGRGVADRHCAAHTPCLATVGADGTPRLRTVVLRGCLRSERTLLIHTDARSAKLREIEADPRACVHVYDARRKIQLRLDCEVGVHRADADAAQAWARTKPASRLCYQVIAPPGSPVPDPRGVVVSAEATADGAAHFAVLAARVARLEFLYLAHQGHRRARFTWNGGAWQGEWLVP